MKGIVRTRPDEGKGMTGSAEREGCRKLVAEKRSISSGRPGRVYIDIQARRLEPPTGR